MKCEGCSSSFDSSLELFQHIQEECIQWYEEHPKCWTDLLSILAKKKKVAKNEEIISVDLTSKPLDGSSKEIKERPHCSRDQSPETSCTSVSLDPCTPGSSRPYVCSNCNSDFDEYDAYNAHSEVCSASTKEHPFCILFQPPEKKKERGKSIHMTVKEYFYASTLSGKAKKKISEKLSKERFVPRKYTCASCCKTLRNNIRFMSHIRHKVVNQWQNSENVNDFNICQHCYRRFGSPFHLQCHIEIVHSSVPSKCICRICELNFDSDCSLLHHMKDSHVYNEMPYVCKACPYRSSFYNDVVAHFRESHFGSTFLMCPFCLAVYYQSPNFLKHVLLHIRKRNTCKRCRLQFVNSKEMAKHLRNHHKTNIVKSKRHKNVHDYQIFVRVSDDPLPPGRPSIAKRRDRVHESKTTEMDVEKPTVQSPLKISPLTYRDSPVTPPSVELPEYMLPLTARLDVQSPLKILPLTSSDSPVAPPSVELPEYMLPMTADLDIKKISFPQSSKCTGHICIECKDSIEPENFISHFKESFECRWCIFMTCCVRSSRAHLLKEHADPELKESMTRDEHPKAAPDKKDEKLLDPGVKVDEVIDESASDPPAAVEDEAVKRHVPRNVNSCRVSCMRNFRARKDVDKTPVRRELRSLNTRLRRSRETSNRSVRRSKRTSQERTKLIINQSSSKAESPSMRLRGSRGTSEDVVGRQEPLKRPKLNIDQFSLNVQRSLSMKLRGSRETSEDEVGRQEPPESFEKTTLNLKKRRKQPNPMKCLGDEPESPKKMRIIEVEDKDAGSALKVATTRLMTTKILEADFSDRCKDTALVRELDAVNKMSTKLLEGKSEAKKINDNNSTYNGWIEYFKRCEMTHVNECINPFQDALATMVDHAKVTTDATTTKSIPDSSVIPPMVPLKPKTQPATVTPQNVCPNPIYRFQLMGIADENSKAPTAAASATTSYTRKNYVLQMVSPPIDLCCRWHSMISMLISWKKPENCEVSQFEVIFRGTGVETSQMLPVTQTLVRLVGLKPNTLYSVRVYSLHAGRRSLPAKLFQWTATKRGQGSSSGVTLYIKNNIESPSETLSEGPLDAKLSKPSLNNIIQHLTPAASFPMTSSIIASVKILPKTKKQNNINAPVAVTPTITKNQSLSTFASLMPSVQSDVNASQPIKFPTLPTVSNATSLQLLSTLQLVGKNLFPDSTTGVLHKVTKTSSPSNNGPYLIMTKPGLEGKFCIPPNGQNIAKVKKEVKLGQEEICCDRDVVEQDTQPPSLAIPQDSHIEQNFKDSGESHGMNQDVRGNTNMLKDSVVIKHEHPGDYQQDICQKHGNSRTMLKLAKSLDLVKTEMMEEQNPQGDSQITMGIDSQDLPNPPMLKDDFEDPGYDKTVVSEDFQDSGDSQMLLPLEHENPRISAMFEQEVFREPGDSNTIELEEPLHLEESSISNLEESSDPVYSPMFELLNAEETVVSVDDDSGDFKMPEESMDLGESLQDECDMDLRVVNIVSLSHENV